MAAGRFDGVARTGILARDSKACLITSTPSMSVPSAFLASSSCFVSCRYASIAAVRVLEMRHSLGNLGLTRMGWCLKSSGTSSNKSSPFYGPKVSTTYFTA